MLHSISTAFKSLLRPSEMNSHEKTPADSLASKYASMFLHLPFKSRRQTTGFVISVTEPSIYFSRNCGGSERYRQSAHTFGSQGIYCGNDNFAEPATTDTVGR